MKIKLSMLFLLGISVSISAQIQLGADISGDDIRGEFALSTSLSSDGKTLAIGTHDYHDSGDNFNIGIDCF